jgi:hypothetical protein
MLKTIIQGILGSLSFGIYYHYTSIKMIEEHNNKLEQNRKNYLIKKV